jgi:D-threo-aldose 1-dehydrogenase
MTESSEDLAANDSGRNGRLEVRLPRWGIGTAPLGGLYETVDEESARLTLERAWACGFRYFDTAPLYGAGQAETLVGKFLRSDELVISTKCGRSLVQSDESDPVYHSHNGYRAHFDFSPAAIRKGVVSSLARLGRDHVDLVLIHDPDDYAEYIPSVVDTLAELRAEGLIGAIGLGMNQWQLPLQIVRTLPIDVILLAGRWTLLDQSGHPLLDVAHELGVPVIAGGVFNSGILAGTGGTAMYDYSPAPPELTAKVERLRSICLAHDLDLPTVAIHFAFTHPAVSTVLVGVRSPAEVEAYEAATRVTVPDAAWSALASA